MTTQSRPQFSAGLIVICLTMGAVSHRGFAEVTLTPWGNVAGMRVDGQPIEFEAGLRIVRSDWRGFSAAVKYLQRPRYSRAGAQRIVESEIEGLAFREMVRDTGPGEAILELRLSAQADVSMAGAYFCVDLPDAEFAGGTLEVIEPAGAGPTQMTLSPSPPDGRTEYLRQLATGVRVVAPRRRLEIRWSEPVTVLVRRDLSNRPTVLNDPLTRQEFVTGVPGMKPASFQVYIEVMAGSATRGHTTSTNLTLTGDATGVSQPVTLVLDATEPGRSFDGIGGNFRLQFPKTDPAVIQYNLENLRVAWGRVAMPWAEWDPQEQSDPLAAARAGQLHPQVHEAMDMARALARRRMPVIVSAWFPPRWARAPGPQPAGLRGTALDEGKMDRIVSSLASYLVFLKERYGVEAILFSFNEPETGVEVRQTPAEHARFNRAMGAHLAKCGLATRMLLGDTAHGTAAALDFLSPSLTDPAAYKYVGAVGFHTWRGCTEGELRRWADAARQLNVPLLVTEAGPDAHLHEYPQVMLEPWFQLQEIELYLRICALGQPATIMEWQLTTDYSVLWGAGVYGSEGPLRPTQRFWNLKQLGLTPPAAFALPIVADRPDVTCAAFGDLVNGQYAVHIVNRGAQRPAVLTGLPELVTALRRFDTDVNRGMEENERVSVRAGKAEFTFPATSFITLLGANAP